MYSLSLYLIVSLVAPTVLLLSTISIVTSGVSLFASQSCSDLSSVECSWREHNANKFWKYFTANLFGFALTPGLFVSVR